MRSVVGLATAQRIAPAAGHKLALTTSERNFRLAVTTYGRIGSFEILIPTPGGVMKVRLGIVRADVPFLLGLGALDQNPVQALPVDSASLLIPMPGDAALSWLMRILLGTCSTPAYLSLLPVPPEAVIFYQHAQLEKLHRSLYHSPVSRKAIRPTQACRPFPTQCRYKSSSRRELSVMCSLSEKPARTCIIQSQPS